LYITRSQECAAKFINTHLTYCYCRNQFIVAYNYMAYCISLFHLNAWLAYFCRQ